MKHANLFQKAVLGTALLAGLVGCAGKDKSYGIVRDGLILKSDRNNIFCDNAFYQKEKPLLIENDDDFYQIGLKYTRSNSVKSSSHFIIFQTLIEDGTGKYRVFKSCIKDVNISKGNA